MIQSVGDRNAHAPSDATRVDGSWNVWLCEPLGLPAQVGARAVRLASGGYTLFQRTSTEFELIPWHVSVMLGRRELEDLCGSGKLIIQGERPGASFGFNLRREETPVELELSADELLALSRSREMNEPAPVRARSPDRLRAKVSLSTRAQTVWSHLVTTARKLQLPAPRAALAPGVAVAAVLMGVVLYLSVSRARPVDEAMVAAVPRTAPALAQPASMPVNERSPVRVANPFDHTEVFEFPPDMSEVEARETVANLLIRRARDRQLQHSKPARFARARPS